MVEEEPSYPSFLIGLGATRRRKAGWIPYKTLPTQSRQTIFAQPHLHIISKASFFVFSFFLPSLRSLSTLYSPFSTLYFHAFIIYYTTTTPSCDHHPAVVPSSIYFVSFYMYFLGASGSSSTSCSYSAFSIWIYCTSKNIKIKICVCMGDII